MKGNRLVIKNLAEKLLLKFINLKYITTSCIVLMEVK